MCARAGERVGVRECAVAVALYIGGERARAGLAHKQRGRETDLMPAAGAARRYRAPAEVARRSDSAAPLRPWAPLAVRRSSVAEAVLLSAVRVYECEQARVCTRRGPCVSVR